MYEQAEEQAKSGPAGALQELDTELERFEKCLSRFAEKVSPITNQYATADVRLSEPRQEPSNQLRGRIERLHDLIVRLDELQGDIDL